jgi:hypothetical protein
MGHVRETIQPSAEHDGFAFFLEEEPHDVGNRGTTVAAETLRLDLRWGTTRSSIFFFP